MATSRTRKQASLTTTDQPATVTPIRSVNERTKAVTEFGAPVYLDELPPKVNKGGRQSLAPVYEKWLSGLAPGKWAELPSDSEEGGHPVNRVAAIRKVAGDAFVIETRPIETGKRYRIFAMVAS